MAKVTKKPSGKASRPQPKAKIDEKNIKLKKKVEKPEKAEKPKAKVFAQPEVNGNSNKADKKEKVKTVQTPKALSHEMAQIRQHLLGMLSQVRKDIAAEVRGAGDRDLAHINDTSDMASDAAEGDLALRIAESETVEAGEIERAIEKIDSGTYGQCEVCNKTINADRLHFLPYVTLCIKCQELAEIRKREEGDELDDLSSEGAEEDN